MGRRYSRWTALVFAILVATGAPRTALADGTWFANCPGGAGSAKVCIYRDSQWQSNEMYATADNFSYQGEQWISSTFNVEDSVSSTKNLYNGKQVRWYEGRNWTGWWICNTPNTGFFTLSIWNNDAFSGHDINQAPCS